MRKLAAIIGATSFVAFVLASCGGGGGESTSSEKAPERKIIVLDTCLNESKDITDYLPDRVKKHEDICAFLRSFVRVGDRFYSNFYQNLNNQAETEMDVSDMNKANDEEKDIVTALKGTYKSLKAIKRTAKGALKTAWSGKDLLDLENQRNEIKSRYSSKVLDSMQLAENTVNKYLYYSYVRPYKEEAARIKSHSSIRTMPNP